MRLRNENGGAGDFTLQNQEIQSSFRNASILRAGAEVRLNRLISLRGGYQHYTPAADGAASFDVYSTGIGFNITERFSIDAAWCRTSTRSDRFQLYENYSASKAPEGINRNGLSQMACTLAFKF